MSTEEGHNWVEHLNKDLKSSLHFRGYAEVKVLALYWKDSDNGYKSEAKEVCRLFEEEFHYSTKEFPIPSSDSYYKLLGFLLDEVPRDEERPTLCIIHYGGHGDRNDDTRKGQERRSVWAAYESGGPTLDWYGIQDIIREFYTDILLLLDCCYAGQAARDRDRGCGKLEVLAAAAMGVMTPPPGPTSFTTILIRELGSAVKHDGFVYIGDLCGHLCNRQQGLSAQPVHFPLRQARHPIKLEPLSSAAMLYLQSTETISLLQVLVQAREELTVNHTEELKQWLQTNVPYVVSGLEVLSKTTHVQKVVQDIQLGEKQFAKGIDTSSREEISNAWDKVVALVENYSVQKPTREDGKMQRAGEFIRQLDTENAGVLDILQRTILTAPGMDDGEALCDAANDDAFEALGISNQLRMRKIAITGSSEGSDEYDLASDDPKGRLVLQEFKPYGSYTDHGETSAMYARVMALSKLLAVPKNASFCALRCTLLSHQPLENRYTLTFEIPEEYNSSKYITLQRVIQGVKGSQRPSLNQRLRLILVLAKAVYHWHLIGWLHQGISSPNVIFFRRGDGCVDYSRPFLHGFEFARPDSDPSIGRSLDDIDFNVYRHPERHGSVRKGHQKKHDIYSLGVIMLEVGLWQKASDLIKEGMLPRDMQTVLRKNCADRLAHFAGEAYQKATGVCLSADLGVELDDASGTYMMRAFKERVIDMIAKGVDI